MLLVNIVLLTRLLDQHIAVFHLGVDEPAVPRILTNERSSLSKKRRWRHRELRARALPVTMTMFCDELLQK